MLYEVITVFSLVILSKFFSVKFVFIFLILVFLSSCYQGTRNCGNFKTGTYKAEVKIQDRLYTSTFKRTEALQIETYDGKTDSSEVRWINDCEVIFKTINPKSRIEKKNRNNFV